jgi:hypothetical protein
LNLSTLPLNQRIRSINAFAASSIKHPQHQRIRSINASAASTHPQHQRIRSIKHQASTASTHPQLFNTFAAFNAFAVLKY